MFFALFLLVLKFCFRDQFFLILKGMCPQIVEIKDKLVDELDFSFIFLKMPLFPPLSA